MSRRGRAVAVAAVGAVVSAAAFAAVFGRVTWSHGPRFEARLRWAELRAAFASARASWLAAFAILNVASLLPRALQLRALARRRPENFPSTENSARTKNFSRDENSARGAGGAPSVAAAWHAVAVGMLAQNLLPARLGEVARAATLARTGRVAPSAAAGAVVLGRVLDLGALLLTTCLPLLFFSAAPTAPARGNFFFRADFFSRVALLGAIAGVLLVLALALLYRKRDAASRLLARLGPRAGRVAAGFTDGLSALADPRRLFAAALASLGAPLVMALAYYCALRAFELELGPSAPLALTAAVFVAVALPSAPSALGVYHAAAFWLLGAFGVAEPRAAAFALATHAIATAALTLAGGWSAARVGYNLAS